MKWSTPLPTLSAGIRCTAVQLVPLLEVLMTISLALQPLSNLQSDQTTKTLPAPSISAVISEPERIFPASVWWLIDATVTVLLQLVPPLVEVKARTAVSLALLM